MARPKKQTVDYFPHIANSGKTIFILENQFGNDGYAFWFKTLELLATTDGHVIDTGNPSEWEFLIAKTRMWRTLKRSAWVGTEKRLTIASTTSCAYAGSITESSTQTGFKRL